MHHVDSWNETEAWVDSKFTFKPGCTIVDTESMQYPSLEMKIKFSIVPNFSILIIFKQTDYNIPTTMNL